MMGVIAVAALVSWIWKVVIIDDPSGNLFFVSVIMTLLVAIPVVLLALFLFLISRGDSTL
jgi:hypothetical protein